MNHKQKLGIHGVRCRDFGGWYHYRTIYHARYRRHRTIACLMKLPVRSLEVIDDSGNGRILGYCLAVMYGESQRCMLSHE